VIANKALRKHGDQFVKVHVNLDERSYDILIGSDFAAVLADSVVSGSRVLLVTDSNVNAIYGDDCEAALRAADLKPFRVVVPAGETTKDLSFVAKLYDESGKAGLGRKSCIAALGGGMVGDLAGFVAASYLRGVKFLQIPTTLLAMVDSSVGGKTGINLPHGKNLAGAFYQPVRVGVNLRTLESLPEREYISGLAEVVKYGVIWDAELFGRLEANSDAVRNRDPDFMAETIARCCEIKAQVVAMDERESGVRAILNFGHTLGHALENVVGYGALSHGEAVAVGMVYAARLSVEERGLDTKECDRLIELMIKLGLPVSLERAGIDDLSWSEVRMAMSSDKKSQDSVPFLVLARELGSVVFGCEVSEEQLEAAYRAVTLKEG